MTDCDIFNKDGSEGEMCGNGVRCVGKHLYDSGIAKKEYISVQTLGGLKILKMKVVGGVAVGARVDMGVPSTVPSVIPVNGDENPLFITEGGAKLKFFCVNCGNPHAVTHDLFPDEETFFRLGPLFEKSSAFPERANISFCKVVDETHLIARIWERGSGPTLACGTGATATFRAIDAISTKTCIAQDMLIVGGGSKSNLWMQIFADVYDKTVLTSEVGQNAGALGAAALAALGLGLIKDFNIIRNAHSHESRFVPNKEAAKLYSRIFPIFQRALILHSELDCMIKKLCLK